MKWLLNNNEVQIDIYILKNGEYNLISLQRKNHIFYDITC